MLRGITSEVKVIEIESESPVLRSLVRSGSLKQSNPIDQNPKRKEKESIVLESFRNIENMSKRYDTKHNQDISVQFAQVNSQEISCCDLLDSSSETTSQVLRNPTGFQKNNSNAKISMNHLEMKQIQQNDRIVTNIETQVKVLSGEIARLLAVNMKLIEETLEWKQKWELSIAQKIILEKELERVKASLICDNGNHINDSKRKRKSNDLAIGIQQKQTIESEAEQKVKCQSTTQEQQFKIRTIQLLDKSSVISEENQSPRSAHRQQQTQLFAQLCCEEEQSQSKNNLDFLQIVSQNPLIHWTQTTAESNHNNESQTSKQQQQSNELISTLQKKCVKLENDLKEQQNLVSQLRELLETNEKQKISTTQDLSELRNVNIELNSRVSHQFSQLQKDIQSYTNSDKFLLFNYFDTSSIFYHQQGIQLHKSLSPSRPPVSPPFNSTSLNTSIPVHIPSKNDTKSIQLSKHLFAYNREDTKNKIEVELASSEQKYQSSNSNSNRSYRDYHPTSLARQEVDNNQSERKVYQNIPPSINNLVPAANSSELASMQSSSTQSIQFTNQLIVKQPKIITSILEVSTCPQLNTQCKQKYENDQQMKLQQHSFQKQDTNRNSQLSFEMIMTPSESIQLNPKTRETMHAHLMEEFNKNQTTLLPILAQRPAIEGESQQKKQNILEIIRSKSPDKNDKNQLEYSPPIKTSNSFFINPLMSSPSFKKYQTTPDENSIACVSQIQFSSEKYFYDNKFTKQMQQDDPSTLMHQ